jgi:hypothetical protein
MPKEYFKDRTVQDRCRMPFKVIYNINFFLATKVKT